MKSFLLLLLLSITAHGATGQVPADTSQFHLYLLIGQSNMAGRGKVEPEDAKPHPRVLTLDKEGHWVVAVDPIHFDRPGAVGVGPGRSFGQAMATAQPGVTIGLIPCAVGASPIESWEPGAAHAAPRSHPWDDMTVRVRAALRSGVLKGVLWHQGESDAKTAATAALYEERLHGLVRRLRESFALPALPFACGQLGRFPEAPWSPARLTVNAAHLALPGKVPHTAFVGSEGLTHSGDKVHFSAASARDLGTRYATAMLRLLGGQ